MPTSVSVAALPSVRIGRFPKTPSASRLPPDTSHRTYQGLQRMQTLSRNQVLLGREGTCAVGRSWPPGSACLHEGSTGVHSLQCTRLPLGYVSVLKDVYSNRACGGDGRLSRCVDVAHFDHNRINSRTTLPGLIGRTISSAQGHQWIRYTQG